MANPPLVRQTCSCECGRSRFEIDGPPIGRLYCHCRICQAFNKGPFADVTFFRGPSVRLAADCDLDFKRHRAFPGLDRGSCVHCRAPVLEFMGRAPLPRLAIVPANTVPDRHALPAPRRHIFYEQRQGHVSDGVPKTEGYWPSELFVAGMILANAGGWSRT